MGAACACLDTSNQQRERGGGRGVGGWVVGWVEV